MKLKTLLLPFATLALCANAFAATPSMSRWSVCIKYRRQI